LFPVAPCGIVTARGRPQLLQVFSGPLHGCNRRQLRREVCLERLSAGAPQAMLRLPGLEDAFRLVRQRRQAASAPGSQLVVVRRIVA
jgi:hypothetical protein